MAATTTVFAQASQAKLDRVAIMSVDFDGVLEDPDLPSSFCALIDFGERQGQAGLMF